MNNIENLKDLIIYQSQNNENISVEVLYNEEDFWLTQKSMSKLFNVAENNITYHLQNIFKTGELEENRITQKIRVVQNEGTRKVSREVTFYSLDAIIAVGYRVNSKEATNFRIWATKTLKEYIKKGFVVNSEFLKNGPKFGQDYFDELLVKIKEIRASERRFYQKITDIYKECSFDYDKNSETTKELKLGKIISMQEWKEKLEIFLKINEYNILKDNGKIKREIADKLALDEYKKYRIIQDKNYISDFDELVIETKNLNNI